MAKPVLYASSGAYDDLIQGGGHYLRPFGTAINPLNQSFGTAPPVQCAGTISKAFQIISANTLNQTSTVQLEVDEVVVSGVGILIPAGQVGLFIDDSGTYTIPDSDPHFVLYYITPGTAVNPFNGITIGATGCLFTAANGHAVSRLGNFTAFPNTLSAQNAGTTQYMSVVGYPQRYLDSVPHSADFYINFNGTASKFAFNPAQYLNTLDGDVHAILQKNGVDTAVDILIPHGSSDVWFYDNTTTVTLTAGDYLRWKIVAGGTTGTLQCAGSAFNVDNVSGYSCMGSFGPERTFSNPAVSYLNICGYITDGSLNSYPLYARVKTNFAGLGCQVTNNNNTTGNAYLRSFINGTTLGNQEALIPPLQIGHFLDDTHSDTLEDGDNIQGQMDMSAAGTLNIKVSVIDFSPIIGNPDNEQSGIYKIVPGSGKTNDTVWNQGFAGTTNVKIPDPFAITVGFGN